MMVRLEIFGTTRLIDEETTRAYSLGSGGHLLAYLVLNSPESVDRRKCAIDLYPDEEYEVSGNRLRVALARFKKILGAALIIEGSELRLDAGELSVDYVETKSQIQAISDLVDVADELNELTALLPKLGLKLLPEISDVWVQPWQEEWQVEALRLLRRLSVLASDEGNWQVVADASQVALKHSLSDPALWKSYFRALLEIGELNRGSREFLAASRSDDCELNQNDIQDIQNYQAELKSGELDIASRWSDSQLINLGRLLARAIEDAPVDAASFFMAPGAIGEFYRDPSTYLPFLYELIAHDEVSEELEQDIRLRIMDAEGLRYQWREVLKQTDFLLAQEMEPARRGRAFFGRSFACFQGRDFESAIEMIQQSAAIYEQLHDEVKAMNSRAVEASFWWHLGEYDKALSMYADARVALLQQDSPIARANASISWANTTTVYTIIGEWEKALEATNECFAAMGIEPNENMLAMFNTISGLVFIANNQTQRGIDLLADGLKRSYRRGSSREQQIGLEWAAGALAYLGHGAEAISVLDWVDEWRKRTEHARSVAENHFVERLVSECGRAQMPKLDPEEDSKRVISFVISMLRKGEKRRGVA